MRGFAAAVLGAALVLSSAQSAMADPRPEAGTGDQTSTGSPAAGRPVTVTLLTGDRVTLPTADAGSGTVEPAAGREHIRFFSMRERGDLHVVPADAQRLVTTGKLDRRLFNVTGLVRAGYHDAARDNLPLIVEYASGGARRSTTTLSAGGARVTRDLPAIDGAAVQADKSRATDFWTAVTIGNAGARTATTGGVDRIWLDGKRQLNLDHSVPQIGAPAAHAAGWTGKGVTVAVLDTGIDTTHPDLAGKVAESRNFSEAEDLADTVGHGTHVASTIAGSGAASGGKYRGVAPDATLLSGKVCESAGCTESALLAGMQWAAAEKRATVVNFSIGGYDGPEIDPLEEAVNTLTEQTGTLFVVSAGNAGQDETIASPGSADAALTVGAVDREDELADFSSRGPRGGDDAIKPDITAPGVEIVAARAAGTTLGSPVGTAYTTASGTSMAAPHVTGSVALLAQQHPDWSAEQFKSTLMASAKPNPGLTAYQQGAGRVDVARAIGQTVTTDPASLAFGRTIWPHADDEPVTRTVTYRNSGTAPLTLDLAFQVTGPEQAATPTGMFQASANQVTVPAGGTAAVTITVDTSVQSPDGYWSGQLVATGGDTTVVTPLGVHKEMESYNLTATQVDADGNTPVDYFTQAVNLETARAFSLYAESGSATARLPKGRYGLTSWISTPRGEEEYDTATLVRPELNLTADQTVTFDARRTRPVMMTVPERSARTALVEVSHLFFTAEYPVGYSALSDRFESMTVAMLGDPQPADKFFGAIGAQWVKRRADGRPVAPSPYLYAVRQPFPGRLPNGYTRNYHAADFATVQHDFRGALQADEQAERAVYASHDNGDGGWAVALPTAVPGKRTEYYNAASGLSWLGDLWTGVPTEDGWLDAGTGLYSTPTKYRRGEQYQEQWNGAPYGASFPKSQWPDDGLARLGDDLLLSVPLYSDAAGHAGYSILDTGRTALYREGQLIGEQPDAGWGYFEGVPPGEARYRVETSATRSNRDLTTRIDAAWTFRSGHVEGEEWVKLPAMAVRFTPRLDRNNAAPAGKAFTIPVTVQRQAGAPGARVKSLTVEVSYDDGKTWQSANLKPASDDAKRSEWTARVQHPAGATYVSLRTKATDTAGNTVSQTVIHAYRLK